MRHTTLFVALGLAALAVMPACTVKDVDQPALAGPSTFAHSIRLIADRDTITQNGRDTATIRVTSTGPNGQEENVKLRAMIKVDGAEQDFGTLSNKEPITPATIIYTAPPPSPLAAGQVPQTITIEVTPIQCVSSNCADLGTDFGSTIPRTIDLRLVPQGIILPTNPNLLAAFTVSPESPKVMETATFDASTTTNGTAACSISCLYQWNFGDGTSGTGMNVTHQFRTINTFNVTLTVTDTRGATAFLTKSVTVQPGTPPTPVFTFSPTPAIVDQMIFFNATESTAAPGRTIVSYEWDFGKGTGASGVTASKSYDTPGVYTVTLKLTDDAGSIATKSVPVTVNSAQIQPNFTIEPSAPVVNQPVIVNASSSTSTAPIVSYSWNFGVNSTPSSGTGVSASTQYSVSGSKVITLTVTDNQGRTASITKVVTVSP